MPPGWLVSSWFPKQADEEERSRLEDESRQPAVVAPSTDYMDKYKKIVGDESAIDGAKNLTPNKQFGFGEQQFIQVTKSSQKTLHPKGFVI